MLQGHKERTVTGRVFRDDSCTTKHKVMPSYVYLLELVLDGDALTLSESSEQDYEHPEMPSILSQWAFFRPSW